MDLLGLARRQDQLKRITEIAGILHRYDLAGWVEKLPYGGIRNLLASRETQVVAELPWEERIRLALTALGTTFIKLGQVLSTRQDLIDPALAQELSKLQAGTPPDPPDLVRRTIQAQLGAPPEELFAEFEPVAFASASMGQVHLARLTTGQPVVVKVQHHGIEETIKADLDLLEALAQVLEHHIHAARPYQPISTVAEFRRTLLRELDFSAERRNQEEFTKNFIEDPSIRFPAVYPHLCARRVLTMELLSGIPGTNTVDLLNSGADLDTFARRAANMYMNMIFRDGFYHADPHPGNYILLPETVVGVLDCGMVGRIDDHLREMMEDFLVALSLRDNDEFCDILLRAGSAPVDIVESVFRVDVTEFLTKYANQSMKEFDLGGALEELTAIIRGHHLILPPGVSLLLKTFVMLEGTARQLSPSFNLMELIHPLRRQLTKQRLSPKRWMPKLKRNMRDLDRLIGNGPRDLTRLLDRLRMGRFVVELEHRRLQAAVNRLVAGILAAALFLGSSQLLTHGIPPIILGVSLPGGAGCTVAAIMGFTLLRTIAKESD